MQADLQAYLQCPECALELSQGPDELACGKCGRRIPVRNGVPFFSEVPADVKPETPAHSPTDQSRWTQWRKLNYRFFAGVQAARPPAGLAVDVGAGERHFRDLMARYPRCLNLDFVPYEGIDVVCDLTRPLPLRSGIAGTVLLSNVLEHLREPEAALRECARLLQPDGCLVLTVPFMAKTHQPPYDFYRYTQFGLEYLLQKAGFRDVEITPLGDLFDVIDSVAITARRGLKRMRNPVSRWTARMILGGMRLSLRMLAGLARGTLQQTPYRMSLPKGFGCVAVKQSDRPEKEKT